MSAPSQTGSALMAVAGIAWGGYSLRGRRAGDPLGDTASNLTRSVLMVLGVSLATLGDMEITTTGMLLAVASGAVASGIGYAIWYAALAGLSATLAATVQLSVPVLAVAGGVLFMSKEITVRLSIASVLILGGGGAALRKPRPASPA